MDYRRFESFCNSFSHGFVKPWKSFSIWHTLENDIPQIKEDKTRLVKYLRNCLEMEGFRKPDIECIAEYVLLDGEI